MLQIGHILDGIRWAIVAFFSKSKGHVFYIFIYWKMVYRIEVQRYAYPKKNGIFIKYKCISCGSWINSIYFHRTIWCSVPVDFQLYLSYTFHMANAILYSKRWINARSIECDSSKSCHQLRCHEISCESDWIFSNWYTFLHRNECQTLHLSIIQIEHFLLSKWEFFFLLLACLPVRYPSFKIQCIVFLHFGVRGAVALRRISCVWHCEMRQPTTKRPWNCHW